MIEVLYVGLGGAMGAMARYLVYLLAGLFSVTSPVATIVVNVIGSFAAGFLFLKLSALPDMMRPLLVVGFLGAFTTFSTFSLDFFQLMEQKRFAYLGFYFFVSTLLSIFAAFVGASLAGKGT